MKKKMIVLMMSLLMMNIAMATPKKIEVVFLSPKKLTSTLELLEQYERIKFSKYISQSDFPKNCVPMGDGCFHPQLGYLEVKNDKKTKAPEKENELQLKTINAMDVNLIDCDPNNYFDIYCGKANKQEVKKKAEIWLDISSSLRSVDYSAEGIQCDRRVFIEKVVATCGKKVGFSIFNTSLKEAGEFSTACDTHGTNDQRKLLQWIKSNTADNLLIVTDVDEISRELRLFLETEGAKIQGDGVTPFTSQDLIDYAKEFSKMCS